MDPISLIAIIGIGVTQALIGMGASAAPVAGAALAAGPVVTAATAIGAPAAVGLIAGSAAPAGLIAADPHAALGAQNGINNAINQAQQSFAGSVNGLNIPGIPQIHFN